MSTSNHDATVLSMPVEKSSDSLSFGKLSASSQDIPQFDFITFFSGHTRANGWFSDRFGRPRRHFCGDFYGESSAQLFKLHEELHFTDGIIENRTWAVEVNQSGRFTAESDSLIGKAVGLITEDTLRMQYRMRVLIEKDKHWELDMKDTMILQADGSLHNITHVYKWGIRIGSVSAMYFKHNG